MSQKLNLRLLALMSVIVFSILMTFLLTLSFLNREISSALSIVRPEIEQDIAASNVKLSIRRLKNLERLGYPNISLQLMKNGELNHQDTEIGKCLLSIYQELRIDALPIGNLAVCLHSKDYLTAVSHSPMSILAYGLLVFLFLSVLGIQRYVSFQKVLREKDRALVTLASQVAHDIRSPLSAINLTVSCLKGAIPEKHMRIIESAVGRMNAISEDLLARQRTRAPERTDISHLIEITVQEKSVELSKQSIAIEFSRSTPTEHPGHASVVPSDFQRILSNILNNAAEAMKHSSGTIKVNLSRSDQNWILNIDDNGIGIPSRHLPRIFERGFSHKQAHTRKAGTGFGLSHAKFLIENWDGTISAESVLNRGTRITICLPFLS